MDVDLYGCFIVYELIVLFVNWYFSIDEIKLYGGIYINGCFVELVCIKKNGKMIFMVIGEFIELIEEESSGVVRIKCLVSEEFEDEEEIMCFMVR